MPKRVTRWIRANCCNAMPMPACAGCTLVDLDGARDGTPGNRDLIRQMASQSRIRIQLGGGLRNRQLVDEAFGNGVSRAVLGSAAVEQPQLLRDLLAAHGPEAVCLAIDVRVDEGGTPRVRTRGWVKEHALSLWELLRILRDTPLRHVLCTDIERDGALSGPGFDLYEEALRRFPHIAWQASGGIRSAEDLARLDAHGPGRRHQWQGPARGPHHRWRSCSHACATPDPCLDVRDGQVVKGVRFRDHRVVGEILELAAPLSRRGRRRAGVLRHHRQPRRPFGGSFAGSSRVAAVLDIPFCVAGGIRSVADAEAILNAGSEKVSVNSPALADPDLIDRLAARFGSQCVVVGIDSQTTPDGLPRVPVHRRPEPQPRFRPRHAGLGARGPSSVAPARSC